MKNISTHTPVCPDCEGVRISLLKFVKIQEIILRKNDYKGGWKYMSLKQLRQRLKQEVNELSKAIDKITKHTAPDIKSECADVANFAMMISDNFNDLHRGIE